MLDVLIRNGEVLDGTGSPAFLADVEVSADTIVGITPRSDEEARRTIDAKGRIVCPGFINMHAHSDLRVFDDPQDKPSIMQGFTTIVLGQDGLSVAPLTDEHKSLMMTRVSGLLGTHPQEWPWDSLGEYLSALEALNLGLNAAMLVPHSAIRALSMGWEERAATGEELAAMERHLAQALSEGAVGLSTGLIYPPAMYADSEELVRLCKVTAEYGGFFVVHMRNEGDRVCESVQEVVNICMKADCRLHISHLKTAGRRNWGKSADILRMLGDAQSKGLEVTFDQYPYLAGSTMLDCVIPPKFHSGGEAQLLERLADKRTRLEIHEMHEGINPEPWDNWVDYAGWQGIVINAVQSDRNKSIEGKTIQEVSKESGKSPLDFVCDLLIEERGGVTVTLFYGAESDLKYLMKSELMTLCSDGIAGGKPHPRVYGTTARFLGKYVREENVLSLAEAVRKVTGAPAQILRAKDFGVLKNGMKADIVVFDPQRIGERGTYQVPAQYPVGIEHVVVRGKIAVDDGELTEARGGVVVRRSV